MDHAPNFPNDFDLKSARGGPRGARLAQDRDGRWWWCPPDADPAVVCGIAGVDATVGTEAADHQVRRWGFNLFLPPTAPAFRRKGAHYVLDLNLNQSGVPVVREEGVWLPDVFHSGWAETVEQRINGVEPVAGLVGWQCDQALRWGGWPEGDEPLARASLLQVCLGLDPAFRAYHSAWDFVLARHRGELQQVGEFWGVALSGRGAIRQITRAERVLDSSGFRRDSRDFIKEYAQRYFSVIGDAARKINPDCLLLSPLLSSAVPGTVREIAASYCDMVQVDTPGLVESSGPRLWCLPAWPAAADGVDVDTGEGAYERRIRLGREALVAGLRDPRVVGYAWTRFRQGDLMGGDPFDAGLVDENGRPNACLIEPLRSINAVAGQLRRGTTPGPG